MKFGYLGNVIVVLLFSGFAPQGRAYPLQQADYVIRMDLQRKVDLGKPVVSLSNPLVATVLGIGKIVLTVARSSEQASQLTNWPQIPINSTLQKVTVTNTWDYVTLGMMNGADMFVDGDAIGVFNVSFEVDSRIYVCGVIIPAEG
ncbi:MAG: hypothetical protein AB7P49_10675, partial [Bdellovibrionales bacterium]